MTDETIKTIDEIGLVIYTKNNTLHNEKEAAVQWPEGYPVEYWIEGKQLTKPEHDLYRFKKKLHVLIGD